MKTGLDQHIGLEIVNCYMKYFDHHENQIHGVIDNMALANVNIKMISDVTNRLAHGKCSEKPLDLSQEHRIKSYIVHIHKNNPTIFEGFLKNFPEHLTSIPEEKIEGEEISLENVLQNSLRHIDLNSIQIDPLTEDQIDVIVQGLDGQLKSHSADLNKYMLELNEKFDNRAQMTESSRQSVKQLGDLSESIIKKTGAR